MPPRQIARLPQRSQLHRPAAVASTATTSATHPSSRRSLASLPRFFPQQPIEPRRRRDASTSTSTTDWISWLKKAAPLSSLKTESHLNPNRALIFAGLGSFPHTPQSPTPSSINIWEQASEALLNPDATIGYWTEGMEEFAGTLQGGGGHGIRGWLRGWVEGRTLTELMARPDVTSAFILSSSIAILASEQERFGSVSLLPDHTTHLAGHGFIGTLTALVAAGRLDLATGVRLARIFALLPPSPPYSPTQRFLTTVLSARHYHSLSSPSMYVPFEDPLAESSDTPEKRRRAMQLILDEVHSLQAEWATEGEWAEAAIINSSKVLSVTGTHVAVEQLVCRLQELTLANPVMDVHMPCPYNTRLMQHAVPKFGEVLNRSFFSPPKEGDPIILDPITTRQLEDPAPALLSQLTSQLRWHKTLCRLHGDPSPPVGSFLTVGRGAKGLGIMLRGELKKRPEAAPPITVAEFGVKETANEHKFRTRPARPTRMTIPTRS